MATTLARAGYVDTPTRSQTPRANIWHFGIYLTFAITDGLFSVKSGISFVEKPNWNTGSLKVLGVASQYDARNIDPNIIRLRNTFRKDWTSPGITSYPINPGDSVSGFSFDANVLDTSPKLYYYDELQGNWAQNTGKVSTYGWTTVPEGVPEFDISMSLMTTVLALSYFVITALRRRRKYA